jgi:hypothetical protein
MHEQLQSPPRLDASPAWIAARREHLVRELAPPAPATRPRRIPRWRVAAVALAVVVLTGGVAIAATGFDLLDWLRSDDPSEATFSVDTTRTVSGSFPDSIGCAAPIDTAVFACAPGGTARWVYVLYSSVEARPEFTREFALDALTDAERGGVVSAERAAQIRADLTSVGDEFFRKIDLLRSVTTIASSHEVRPGIVLVPPAGVPQFVTCEGASELKCRAVANTSVPVGAPIYGLVENDEWVERRVEETGPRDVAPLFEALFGRPLSAAEERLLIVLWTAAGTPQAEAEGPVEVAPDSPGP